MSAASNAKNLTCEYCNRSVRDCICIAEAEVYYSREGLCAGCGMKNDACICGMCRACDKRADDCVCLCERCKYPGNACRCYEGYEDHPDALACPHCYSDPCECEKVARQKDLNREADATCDDCGRHHKLCRCGHPTEEERDD